ncbi:S1 family peptidase, partial [Akkermansia sp.]
MKILSLFALGSLILLGGCQPREAGRTAPEPQPGQQPETPPEQVEETAAPAQLPSPTNSMVGINATNQGYAMVQPWSKENPAYSQGFGIYLGDGNILTAANIVYSASFVEVTSADGSQTVPVIVTAFDPEANLALLRLKNETDAAFLDKLVPVTLGNAPRLGDKVTFWQFNDDGLPITTSGTLLATESSSPFTNSEPFVLYNVKSSVTPLKGGAGNPIM